MIEINPLSSMAKMIRYRLKASMLLEAIIATVIIAVCFGFAVGIYANVMRSGDLKNQLKAQLMLNDFAIKIKTSKRFIDDWYIIGDCSIDEKVVKCPNTGNLYQLKLTLSSAKGKVLARHDELIIE